MYRYFTARNTRRYIDVVLDLLHSAIRAIMGLVALTALGMDWTEELKTTQ